jgi:hypothetical protein
MRRLNEEDGATVVIVAISLVVLFGMGALVLDVGNLFWERRQLQNGAEAGALAAAQDLATGETVATAEASASTYTSQNNTRDAFVDVFEPASNSVTVGTITGSVSGPGVLDAFLAGVIGTDEYFTRASATVEWGSFGGGTTIPIAICERNWNYFTADGTNLPSGPPAHVLRFATAVGPPVAAHQDCTNPSGDTYPGGFAFLNRNADCMAESTEDGWFDGKTGNNLVDPHSSCDVSQVLAMFNSLIDNNEVALIPIFNSYQGSGNSGQFHVIGYGAFQLQGYSINAGNHRYGMSASECTGGGASCLKGYYTEFVALDGELSNNPDGYGASIIYLTG